MPKCAGGPSVQGVQVYRGSKYTGGPSAQGVQVYRGPSAQGVQIRCDTGQGGDIHSV